MAGSTWLNRSRHYPIFSLPWYRYRSMALMTVTLFLCLVAGALLSAHRLGPLVGWWDAAWLAGIVIAPLLLACLLGPGLAVMARRLGLPRHLESAAIACALLGGLATSACLGIAMAQHFQFPAFDKKTGILTTRTLPVIETQYKIQWGQSSMEWGPHIDARYRPGYVPAAKKELPPVQQEAGLEAVFDSLKFKRGQDDGSGKMSFTKTGEASSDFTLPVLHILALMYVCWLGGVFDLFAFVRQRSRIVDVLQREELKRAQNARNAAELRLSVLAAQIEPHFLFNTLASVRSAIASDPQRAAQIVDHMVGFLRSTIPQMRDDASSVTVPLAGQLDSARSYLALMKERIARLQFEIISEPGLDTAQLPPLMLISLVENAVKHGVEPKVGAARIDVLARRIEGGEGGDGAQLEVTVSDDGVGFGDTSSGGGIGLSNIQERLRALFGSRASLTLKALPSGGVAAILRLPLTFES